MTTQTKSFLRALLLLWTIFMWINVILVVVVYGTPAPAYLIWPAIALTVALAFTSERLRRWLQP